MKKRFTLLFTAIALYFIPAFAQVPTNDLVIDSLEGFNAQLALSSINVSHEPEEAANQLKMLQRNYIDKTFQVGRYAPGTNTTYLKEQNPTTPQAACSN